MILPEKNTSLLLTKIIDGIINYGCYRFNAAQSEKQKTLFKHSESPPDIKLLGMSFIDAESVGFTLFSYFLN